MSNCLCSNIDSSIVITGLCVPTNIDLTTNLNWTQISVAQTLEIPEEKPDMEEINELNISVEIISKKVIVTPTGTNDEGKALTGFKLIIEGLLCNTISYTALLPDQPIHTAHIDVPFSAYIVLPTGTLTTAYFDVISCIEDVFIKECTSTREIFSNVTLFLQAVPSSPGCDNIDACGNSEDLVCSNNENILITGVTSVDLRTLTPAIIGTTWTQMDVSEILSVPVQKPDIEQLISLYSTVDIISQKVIITPIPPTVTENLEGTILTGRKLIIEGILSQKIVYTADVPSQSIHSVRFDIPFSAFIVLPTGTALSTKYTIEPYIEDIFICASNKRQIFKNITLFIMATICV